MSRRTHAAVIACVLGLVLSPAAGRLLAAGPPACPPDLVIKGVQGTKPPVPFSHARHASVDCQKCHHTTQKGEAPASCFGCHKGESGTAPKAQSALHKACIPCHQDLAKKGEKTGPVKCDECHKAG